MSWIGWKIALFGTNDYYATNDNSEVDLTVLGVADPMNDPDWVVVDRVVAIDSRWVNSSDPDTAVGNIALHQGEQVNEMSIQTYSYAFPDEMHLIDKIAKALNYNRVFLFKGDYPGTADWALHPDGKAIQIAGKIGGEDQHEYGAKSIIIDCRRYKPRRQ